jgi:hypothetical protein
MTAFGSPDSSSPAGNPNEVSGGSAGPLMTGNQLIGNVAQIIAYDLRLRTDSQKIVARSFDEHGFPAGSNCAERVPCMAGDKT